MNTLLRGRSRKFLNGSQYLLSLSLCIFLNYSSMGQEVYSDALEFLEKYPYENRIARKIPPKGEVIRVIIDSDAKNEIDDQ